MYFRNFFGSPWKVALVAVLLAASAVGPVQAGPEEDFAAGMISYRRTDFSTAIPVLRKAADAGHAQAQAVLASILDAADQDEEAVAYYRKSAAAGNLDGIFGLGNMLAAGEGVAKDAKEARRLYLRAAESGHKLAIAAVAEAYIRGELGVPEGERKGAEALKWISLAAEDNVVAALEVMEKAYRGGDFGLRIDLAKADQFKRKLDAAKGIKDKKGRRRGEKQ
ncbi:MAG: sel1 repeat family protein [Rhodocyclales bacterium]|nr:sel1 repeat family protein [Rhodocyclales bacterium]